MIIDEIRKNKHLKIHVKVVNRSNLAESKRFEIIAIMKRK